MSDRDFEQYHQDYLSLPPRPADERRRPAAAMLILLLVVPSLALGAVLNWGLSQRRQAREAAADLAALRVDQAMIAARQAQLAELLVDPRSELIRLHGTNHAAHPQIAIVWNTQRRLGMLFANGLPPSDRQRQYQLWLQSDHETISGGVFSAAATVTVHVFQPRDRLEAPLDFVVTLEPEGGAAAPQGPVMFVSGGT